MRASGPLGQRTSLFLEYLYPTVVRMLVDRIVTPRERHWEQIVLPKNKIQCPWPRLEPGLLDLDASEQAIRSRHLQSTPNCRSSPLCFDLKRPLFAIVSSVFFLLNPNNNSLILWTITRQMIGIHKEIRTITMWTHLKIWGLHFLIVRLSKCLKLLKHILGYSTPLRTNLDIRTLRSGSQSIHLTLGKLKLQPDQSVNQSLNLHLVRNNVTVEVVIL